MEYRETAESSYVYVSFPARFVDVDPFVGYDNVKHCFSIIK